MNRPVFDGAPPLSTSRWRSFSSRCKQREMTTAANSIVRNTNPAATMKAWKVKKLVWGQYRTKFVPYRPDRRVHQPPQQRWRLRRRQVLRYLVQQELATRRMYGDDRMEGVIAIRNDVHHDNEAILREPPPQPSCCCTGSNTTAYWQALSEEELLAFLQELEHDEDVQEKNRFLTYLEEIIELENDYWEDQYGEYEQWQNQQQSHVVVPCPICHHGYLLQEESSTIICCSNAAANSMDTIVDGGCSFRFSSSSFSHQPDIGLILSDLSTRLQNVHQEHAVFCRELLCCRMDKPSEDCAIGHGLTAICESCGIQRRIV